MVRTKQDIIDQLLRVAIEASTRHRRGTNDHEYLLFDLEIIEKYLRFIKEFNLKEKDEFVDVTGTSFVTDMLLSNLIEK